MMKETFQHYTQQRNNVPKIRAQILDKNLKLFEQETNVSSQNPQIMAARVYKR